LARILSTSPESRATGVIRNVFLTAQFEVDLSRNTVTDLTVLLVKTSDRSIVDGIADYIVGTRTVTFQVSELLEANTEYTWILVGRTEGIKTLDGQTALAANEQITFKTGTEINPGVPLAPAEAASGDIQAFSGAAGIYTEVFGRTGEPVSHIVTTAGQVGPSGQIFPAPAGSAVYLALSGTIDLDPITISGTVPVDGDHLLLLDDMSTIEVAFSDAPLNTGLEDSGIELLAVDVLGQDVIQPTWTVTTSDNKLIVTPSEWRGGTDYTVTVSKDIWGGNSEPLGTDYTFTFNVRSEYYFTTVKMVRANLGSAISAISDESIEELIYENSLWAYEHAASTFDVDNPPLYVKDYVLCKTKLDVLNTALMGTDSVTQERIGEVEFKYGDSLGSKFKEKIAELKACIEDNKIQLLSLGRRTVMGTAVKAGAFPGRPGRDGTWRRISTDGGFGNRRNAPGNGI
jgi:hypothetical protein